MQIIKPDLIILPTPFQLITSLIIIILILIFFIKEHIKNFKRKRIKPLKKKNDIQKRLEKANKQYYKKFNKQP